MSFDAAASVIVQDDGRIRTITFHRPEAYNAFDEAMFDTASDALIAADADDSIAVVLVTGAGVAFSAGADMTEMDAEERRDLRGGGPRVRRFIDQLAGFRKPLIGVVNGLAVGVGATMLGLLDLVFVSTDARARSRDWA